MIGEKAVKKTLKLQAPAKLNLFLHILGKRDDGYHNIQTVFQIIDLADNLTFSPNDSGNITIKTMSADINLKSKLVYKAASTLQPMSTRAVGCHIDLDKNIPIGAGLGGGSSDAATTLLALNKLWNINLSTDELCQIGVKLGADVPVFIHGHSAWAEGIGERISPIQLPQKYYLIINPRCQINTKQIYQHPKLPRNSEKLKLEQYQIGMGHNDFTTLAAQLEPEIQAAINWLSQHASAQLTGSGACVFATFESLTTAIKVAEKTPKKWQAFTTKGLNQASNQQMIAQY